MSSTQQKNYTLPIIMMILLFGMISFVTNLAAPMGVVLKNQFGVSNFMGMLGNFANFIAYAVMGIPAGKLLERVGYKKTALIAIVVGFVGVGIQVLSGTAGSFAVYLLGAFVAGFSMCMLNTVVNPMLNTLGGGGNKGNQLIQIGGSFNSLMGTLVPILVGALVGEATKAQITDVYPVMFMAMGIFALVGIVLYFVSIPEPHAAKADASLEKSKYSAWSFRHFVLGAIAIGVYVGIEVGIPGTMMLFIADPATGVANGAASAGVVAGMYWLLMLVGRFVGASVASRVSSKSMLTFASGVGIILVTLAIFLPTSIRVSIPVIQTVPSISVAMTEVPINVLFLILCGLCTSIMWGGIFNLAVEGLGKYIAAASGIFMMMVCGGGILPLIQNAVADAAGYLTSYWVPFLGLAYLLYYALIGSKNVNKDIPVD
ncbi:FHS family L-fucose permease-like MFS transporter [Parabacteroides sp. PF5-5]|uniref:MFS transporter n=1 Tax=unclassified Parabacteroides TaxID=2649774 RepID=UPI0024755B28|nr:MULTISPECIES: MFS transporter [unclassified Parabacteroides]MDH6306137.1 FHS family L-fucose permease-like MFS transporter [Parabacteroides sp. PH5-39]MDH6317096.1 FHS family L-fucose permease-like MFS transporter [Parabacteroides sp. PF5-13]MDH6320849.1 FHS family L-fucose permease-like MFS transporter [Parabacteroides sp. PH5-13]MDH6324580.1 FHS family L-fucose permease-like MFS transporter [Parabacteroides sp. PH5-8]MDH6328369.1 FHS family L-fucose permease-like MFS transporter [Parabact